jgi:hypothetical protein
MEQLYIIVHPYHIKHSQETSSVVGTVSGFIPARRHGTLQASSKTPFSALVYTTIMTIYNVWHYGNPKEDTYNYSNKRQNHRNHWVVSGRNYFEQVQYD